MHKRNFGLDVLRAAAISFVLFNHILNFFITFHRSTVIGDISGIFGVEIFFVLSGFLIGRMILTTFVPDMSHHTIKKFYLRRWFRTLPLYYFLLILFIIAEFVTTKKFNLHIAHFVFLQNFFPLQFFSISWSLAIEEWFYLLVPLLIFMSYKLKLFTKHTMYFILLLIGCVIALRVGYILLFHPTFDDIRKNTFLRFDSLFIGVFLAGIKLHLPNIYKHLQKPYYTILSMLGIVIITYWYIIYYVQIDLNPPFFVTAFALPIVSLLIAITVPFFEFNPLINNIIPKFTLLKQGILWTSLFSYSLYLIHVNTFDIVKSSFPSKTSGLILLPLGLLLTFSASYLLYRYIERPFMQLREVVAPAKKS